ncbi:MAG TPA: type II secretion system F family protein [Candidatus Hydrothermia bacterium]|nr:type II secretion system F family protein [Candidatus Hydrothermia bacterium]HRD22221.1 type II secretion system F family protein [Candidatus Hydrothermia bacterium]
MPRFSYTAKDREGKIRTGAVNAKSSDEVVSRLRSLGLSVIKVEEERRGFTWPFGGKPGSKDLAIFSRQFAVMIEAGVSLTRALEILSEQTEKRKLKDAILKVRREVEGGKSIGEAMKEQSQIFPDLIVQMVAVGEQSGQLVNTLKQAAIFYEKMDSIQRKVKSAMAYPVVVFIVLIAVTAGMLIFIIPSFAQMYAEVGAQLPAPTRFVIGLSNFLKNYILIILAVIIVLIILYRRFKKTERGKYVIDNFMMHVIIFGNLIKKVAIARFARTLSILISSGLELIQSLKITGKASGNKVIEKGMDTVSTRITGGETITRPIQELNLFPPLVVHLISVGEESGRLAEMLTKIADFYDDEVDTAVATLASTIEPVMIVIIGVFVGGILISMYLPIFGLAGTIQ